MTPDTARAASLEYEASLFSRDVLPQQAREVRDANGTVRYAINSLGYRGRAFAVPKPPGVIRIVALGGSAAFDPNANEGHDWTQLVEDRLHAAGHPNVEVVNAAVPGYATWDLVGRLYSEIWTIQPDYVLVYEAWNDIKYFGWLTPSHSLLRGYRPAPTADRNGGLMVANPFIYYTGPLDRFLCYSQLYTHLRRRYWWWRLGEIGFEGLLKGAQQATKDSGSHPDTYPPWGVRQYELDLRLIADAARDIGATPIYLTQARLVTGSNTEQERAKITYDYVNLSHDGLVRAFADCDGAIRRAATAENVDVLDLSQRFSGRNELFVDHVHLSPRGSQEIATAVADFLQQRLAQQ